MGKDYTFLRDTFSESVLPRIEALEAKVDNQVEDLVENPRYSLLDHNRYASEHRLAHSEDSGEYQIRLSTLKEQFQREIDMDKMSGENNHRFGKRGAECYQWRGGISHPRNTTDYKEWRARVYKKDNYTCKFCKDESSRDVILNALPK